MNPASPLAKNVPRATYRLQFRREFGFAEAARLAPYLELLGISHVYASPWLKARSNSPHGYDIVDHHALNPDLGTNDDFENMVHAFTKHGLRLILDMVPNHMGVGGSDNPLWLDVLEWGADSAFAGWFDIDWHSEHFYLRSKLLIPFLGDQYGVELFAGRLMLKFDPHEGSFAVWAYDTHKLPIAILHYGRILSDSHPELERLSDSFAHLPEWHAQAGRRARELQAELARAAAGDPEIRQAIDAAVARYNGVPGVDESWKNLSRLIRDQHWYPAYFRVAADDINYRRFFNINELAGIRMDLPDVFEHTHSLVFRMVENGTIDGLRIDHVDGLLNPKHYLHSLRERLDGLRPGKRAYLVVEKILAPHESLREDWPVDGTTGYEFGNQVLGLLVNPASVEVFTAIYAGFTGENRSFNEVVRECKLRIMRNEMASELNVLAREAARIAHQNPRTADFTWNVLRRAIREIVACFPVYRVYIDAEGHPSDEDRRDLNWAIKHARTNETSIHPSVFDFVAQLVSGDLVRVPRSGFSRHTVLRFAMKLQQYSGPVMAKGLEDTAFYRYNRFVALNEVGGHPGQFALAISGFHRANTHRARHWPGSMLTTSTHDTKRGEDARARLAVLSEMPDEWNKNVQAWSRILRARRGDIEGKGPPGRNDEYLFYQLLVATWPMEMTVASAIDPDAAAIYSERLKGALTKAIREAKVASTWESPNIEYEQAVLAFADGALDPGSAASFHLTFLPFMNRVARFGVENSLVQVVLKLTSPGVPDIYQGAELWDLSLMDPDNRRPVDFARRSALLDRVNSAPVCSARILMENWRCSAIKLHVITRILQLRSRLPEVFEAGDYESLNATGPKADCVCAFSRRNDSSMIVVAVARFPARRHEDPSWGNTQIPTPQGRVSGRLHDILTSKSVSYEGGVIEAADVFDTMPVAVLVSEP